MSIEKEDGGGDKGQKNNQHDWRRYCGFPEGVKQEITDDRLTWWKDLLVAKQREFLKALYHKSKS